MAMVRMLKTAAGPEGVFPAGALVEMEGEAALLLVEVGAAAWVDEPAAAPSPVEPVVEEAAVVTAPERAVRPRPKARRGGL